MHMHDVYLIWKKVNCGTNVQTMWKSIVIMAQCLHSRLLRFNMVNSKLKTSNLFYTGIRSIRHSKRRNFEVQVEHWKLSTLRPAIDISMFEILKHQRWLRYNNHQKCRIKNKLKVNLSAFLKKTLLW